ncbi:unnamed protein product [Dibothriocephalus latus]|uniref:UDENN domain-containing protein n=1 Tax=Dibothriocephalus latus TaxID=60516 RepID=A0A3P7LRH9_DIBLA|nr:unnamed protein product [Dibothriocephalus latus]
MGDLSRGEKPGGEEMGTPFPADVNTAISEPFASLLTILGTELCLQLLVQLLTEQKILLTSVQPDLLAHIAQALISIIYPLRWVLVYIPFIHIRCIHVIQSPSPYLIGVDSRFFEFFRLPQGENITCIDLDTRNFRAATENAFKDTKCLPRVSVFFDTLATCLFIVPGNFVPFWVSLC